MAEIVFTNGKKKIVRPKNCTDFQLEEMQKIVGGYIETLRIGGDRIMVVNEEGKLKDLEVNEEATHIARCNGYADIIVGDVLICDDDQIL